jgi:hypothetical protein
MQAAATVQRMFATVAVIKRAERELTIFQRVMKSKTLTIWNVQNDYTANQQSNDLNCVTHRLELSRPGGAEAHVANNDRRKRVDNTIWNSPKNAAVSVISG